MVNAKQIALNDAAEWLGDWHPLAHQLGSASGLVALASVSRFLRLRSVQDMGDLRLFLQRYLSHILMPFELPIIRTAHAHAERNELRELVRLDRELNRDHGLAEFCRASRRVGRGQLLKLRPLRDHRFVQRYLAAVESGRAHGWHTLVYGMTLAVYSLPLRQGLLGYAHQITRGFIYAAAPELRLSERQCRRLFNELTSGCPRSIEALLAGRDQPTMSLGIAPAISGLTRWKSHTMVLSHEFPS